jgi:ribonuclease HI
LDPSAAEALAMFYGVNFCKDLGISKLFVESDAQVVVSSVRNGEADYSRFGHMVDDIRAALSSFPQWKIGHVCRISNRAAHGLAKAAVHKVMDCKWEYAIPDCIGGIVLAELQAAV